MLRCGLDLDGRLLALAAASHSGEDFHVAGVREILARAGLAESDLQCPPDLPLDEAAAAAWLRAGGVADRVHMNCSGKHAAMLATCVAAGWPTASYRDPDHPLQVQIGGTVERLAGEPVTRDRASTAAARRCWRSRWPGWPGPSGRWCWPSRVRRSGGSPTRCGPTRPGPRVPPGRRPRWSGAVPGLLMKSGAEGVCAFALADGRAAAVKFDDGAQRPVAPLMATLLRDLLTAGPAPGPDADCLSSPGSRPRPSPAAACRSARSGPAPLRGAARLGAALPGLTARSYARARLFAIASAPGETGSMSPVNVSSIGSYIREQREQAKISIRQLAQAAGVSNPYLSQVERGLRRPSADLSSRSRRACGSRPRRSTFRRGSSTRTRTTEPPSPRRSWPTPRSPTGRSGC